MRPWQKIADCRWDGSMLVLVADNDYDDDGEVLADEFSDTIAGYARYSEVPGTNSIGRGHRRRLAIG